MKPAIQLFAIAALACAWCGEIPKHPRDLKYPPLTFTPPRAADYRHKLASGATAYFVEDHELPLIHISVLVRTGEYLEPAGKRGLAPLTGSQIRSGGTESKPPAVFDEDAAFLAATLARYDVPHPGSFKKITAGRRLWNFSKKELGVWIEAL